VIEVGFGSRSCDGDPAACRAFLAQGGWGTAVVGHEEPIPRSAAHNAINTVRPVLVDPVHGNYAVVSPILTPTSVSTRPPITATPPVSLPPLVATFQTVAATMSQAITSMTVTFNRAVRGVTLNDFQLTRGRTVVSLAFAGARIATTDGITHTISGIRGPRLVGSYTLRLKAAGTGSFDAADRALTAPASVAWRMTRTGPATLLFAKVRR